MLFIRKQTSDLCPACSSNGHHTRIMELAVYKRAFVAGKRAPALSCHAKTRQRALSKRTQTLEDCTHYAGLIQPRTKLHVHTKRLNYPWGNTVLTCTAPSSPSALGIAQRSLSDDPFQHLDQSLKLYP